MKKNLIAVAVLASSAFGMSAFANDGQVNFTGEIIETGCNVVNDTANPLEVKLGKIAKTAFTGSGSTAAAKSFTLKLSNCPEALNHASVQFDGTSVDGDSSVLALTGAGTTGVAEGVGIQLSDNANTVLPLFSDSKSYNLLPGVINKLDFVARYIAIADDVSAGVADSTATFSINYN